MARAGAGAPSERLFTFSAGGAVRTWELDAEQGCDIYKCLVS